MFDFLKKKITAFTEKIKQVIERKPVQEAQKPAEEKTISKIEVKEFENEEIVPVLKAEEKIEKEIQEIKVLEQAIEKKEEKIEKEIKETVKELKKTDKLEEEKKPKLISKDLALEKKLVKEIEEKELLEEKEKKLKHKEEILEEKQEQLTSKQGTLEEKIWELKKKELEEGVKGISEEVKKLKEEKRELKAKHGIAKQITGLIFGSVTIEEKDVKGFLEEFELSLLEADVEQDTAAEVVKELRKELVGKKVKKNMDLTGFLKKEIKSALVKVMQTDGIDLLEKAKHKKPFVILMLGPNGAGKTTSIAKLTHYFKLHGKKVILASADTFRAGSIEQIEVHAERLGTRVVKHGYGADPAAVAFDAVKAAEAEKSDIVLIDSAGRQETNKNLMEELKKINRVVKPDFRIFVGEALSGQTFLSQAEKFDAELGVDGFILTKIDTDAKGGTAISLLYKIKKPILFVGTGQDYGDLEKFTPEFVLDRII